MSDIELANGHAPSSAIPAAEAQNAADYDDDGSLNWGQFCSGLSSAAKAKTGKDWASTIGRIVALLTTLYFFLFSLDLMGGSFKVLGGCSAGGLFDSVTNPIAGLMIGILATILVQSSSTSTSIVVSLVGSGAMSVQNAIPVIMGANIGTSVTNTIVSMGQIGDPQQFKLAFAGATVHDMFNFLTVLIMLPLELITGVLFYMTRAMVPSEMGEKGDKWEGPLKQIVAPFVDVFLRLDKKIINAVAEGKTTCEATYADAALEEVCNPKTGLLSAGLISCKCDKVTGEVLSCPLFYKPHATQSDDSAAGAVALIISLFMLCSMLMIMVKLLQSMIFGTSAKMIKKSTDLHPILSMLLGAVLTVLVQSSSVVTSVLTPLVGVGVLPIEKMFPLTLGANVGTTCTALLASLVSTKPEAVQIALCHLFFNIFGTLIWYPIPWMRQWPLRAAKFLGDCTLRYRATPLVYILVAFVIVPGCLLGLSFLFEMGSAYLVLGVLLLSVIVLGGAYTVFWFLKMNGKSKLLDGMAKVDTKKTLMRDLVPVVLKMQEEIEALKKAQKTQQPSVDASDLKLQIK